MKKTLLAMLMVTAAVTVADAKKHETQERRIAQIEETLAQLKQEAENERAQKVKDGKNFRVPGTDQTVELILRPTLNVIGDFGQRGGDTFDVGSLPLKDVDAQHRGRGGHSMTPAGTRLGFKTNHDTAKGPVKSHFEMDFNGRNSATSAGRITPRLRHAYISYNQFLFGQTNTLFHDTNTMLDTVELCGVMNGPLRQAQVRFAHKMDCGFDMGVSFERPFTDTVWRGTDASTSTASATGTRAYTESPTLTEGVSTRGTYSQPAAPDAVVGVKYETPLGHIGVRGLARDLRVKYLNNATNTSGSDFTARKTGYGVGVSGSVNACAKLTFVGQYNVGRGIGRYVPDATGYSAYIDPINKQMELIRVSHYLVGAKYAWTPDVTTNVTYQRVNITPSKLMSSSVNNWNKKLDQLFVNTFVNVMPNTKVGVEYMYAERQAQAAVGSSPAQPNGAKGTAHRVQMIVMYTF